MDEVENAQTTLRDQLSEQMTALETAVSSAPASSGNESNSATTSQTAAVPSAPAAEPTSSVTVPATDPVKARPPRPSSWKKDYEAQWETLDPSLAEYIHQRESEYAKGVSTYKAEADRARGLNDAIAPFMPELQQYNIDPKTWITNLGNAHKALALGTPEQKLQMFARLAQDYGVDLAAFSGQQADPRFSNLSQQLQEVNSRVENFARTQQAAQEEQIMGVIRQFAADTERHPLYEQVKDTMAELLQAGLAPDLETAYSKAIRLNDDAWKAEQARQHQAEQAKLQQAAEAARAKAVSPKSATPAGKTAATNAKDRRALLEEQFDSATSGRV